MNNKKKIVGKKREFDELIERLKSFETQQKQKYDELIKQIESLLPGATSAGLAKEFRDQKNSYSIQIILNSIFFYIVLVIIFIVALTLIIDINNILDYILFENGEETFKGHFIIEYKGFQDAWAKVLPRLVLMTPLIWMAFVISKNRNQAYRLKQEYAHKEAVSASIENYSRQIEKLKVNRDELMSQLISMAIDSISKNTAETLDKHHGDRPPFLEIIYKYAGKGKND